VEGTASTFFEAIALVLKAIGTDKVHRGANIDSCLAYLVWPMVKADMD
jgi:hypothetical protein